MPPPPRSVGAARRRARSTPGAPGGRAAPPTAVPADRRGRADGPSLRDHPIRLDPVPLARPSLPYGRGRRRRRRRPALRPAREPPGRLPPPPAQPRRPPRRPRRGGVSEDPAWAAQTAGRRRRRLPDQRAPERSRQAGAAGRGLLDELSPRSAPASRAGCPHRRRTSQHQRPAAPQAQHAVADTQHPPSADPAAVVLPEESPTGCGMPSGRRAFSGLNWKSPATTRVTPSTSSGVPPATRVAGRAHPPRRRPSAAAAANAPHTARYPPRKASRSATAFGTPAVTGTNNRTSGTTVGSIIAPAITSQAAKAVASCAGTVRSPRGAPRRCRTRSAGEDEPGGEDPACSRRDPDDDGPGRGRLGPARRPRSARAEWRPCQAENRNEPWTALYPMIATLGSPCLHPSRRNRSAFATNAGDPGTVANAESCR